MGNALFQIAREEPVGPRFCKRCGHLTAGTRNWRPNYCGPCINVTPDGRASPKPIGWWNGYEELMRKLGAYPKDKEKATNGVDSPVVEETD